MNRGVLGFRSIALPMIAFMEDSIPLPESVRHQADLERPTPRPLFGLQMVLLRIMRAFHREVAQVSIYGPCDTTRSTEEPGWTVVPAAGEPLITIPAANCVLVAVLTAPMFRPASPSTFPAWD